MPGLEARRAAVQLLHAVTVLGRPLDRVLDGALYKLKEREDRALARALASLSLRHLPGLDALIDGATVQSLPPDARARQALRIALAGRLLLDTPPHAAIATILPLLEGGPRRLVHGVLSTLFRTGAQLAPASLPEPWAERWRPQWGDAMVEAAAAQFAAMPPADLRLADPAKTAEWAARLGATSLMPAHLRLAGSQTVEALAGFAEGAWWVQDVAAQLPVTLMGDVSGKRVLDLCAAPGGKTMQLAAAGAHVTALDISAPRMAILAGNLARTGLPAEQIVADARSWEPEALFDAILLDAPCSATGTFRRHPDTLHLKAALDLGPLQGMQRALLARAAAWLKPGGLLVSAVCSLERGEGEDAREALLAGTGLVADPVEPEELPEGLAPDADGAVRTLPGLWSDAGGADGFYIFRATKAQSATRPG